MFPTGVGMNRVEQGRYDRICVPHRRGDEPGILNKHSTTILYLVFPTGVGMKHTRTQMELKWILTNRAERNINLLSHLPMRA